MTNELRINSLRNTVDNLNKSLGKRNNLLENVTREKNNLLKNLEVYTGNHKLLLSKIITLQEHKKNMCYDFSLLAEKYLEMNKGMDVLMKRLENICKMNEATKSRIAHLIEDVINHSEDVSINIEEFKKHLKNKVTEIIKKSVGKFEDKTNKGFQIKGNPVEDLSHQIKENQMKIKSLQAENEKLASILTKFQLMRTIQ